VVAENATIEDIDIDHVAFNIPIHHEKRQLSTEKERNWHCEAWNFLVICWNPVIILTMFSNELKGRLCNYFCANGHTILPSGEEAKHLIRGSNKPVPTMVLLAALIYLGVELCESSHLE
jgi:hypothetical protein